jgi:PAS domain S-box-containing protein
LSQDAVSPELRIALGSRDFLDSMGVGLVLQSPAGEIVDCNVAATELLGLSLDQLMGRTSFDPDWGAVHLDGSAFAGEDHPAMVSLRTGEKCRGVIMGVDNAGRARRWISIDAWPILSGSEVLGVITTFDDQTERVIRDKSFRALAGVNDLTVRSREESTFLGDVATSLVHSLGYARASFVVDAPSGAHEAVVADEAGDVEAERDIESDATVLEALRTRTVCVENDLASTAADSIAARRGFRSQIAVPLRLGGRGGAMVLYGERPFDFDELTAQGLLEIARVIEVGADHVRAMTVLASAFDGTLAALAHVVEARDPYTAGHQSNVGALSEAIATRLGLGAELVGQIRHAAEVHDVGKVTVPAEILTKPGLLGPLEHELVRTHTRVGAEILTKASLPWPIPEVALQHHERLDGSGYPEGLRGEEIIVPARIVAVADVFEAMVQHRPYRAGLGREVALDELRGGAGRLYDADAAAALEAVLEGGFSFDERRDETSLIESDF